MLSRAGNKLSALKTRSRERIRVVEQVRAVLPPRLAQAVASAGMEGGRLTIGVMGAVWASRLRYSSDVLRKRVGAALGVEILTVRIRVIPPAA